MPASKTANPITSQDCTPRRQLLVVPAHWTPEEALAVFELVDDLRDPDSGAIYQINLQDLIQQQRQPAALQSYPKAMTMICRSENHRMGL